MKQLHQDIDSAIRFYPEFKKIESNARVRVVGSIILVHPEIGEYDKYEVSITFPECYPKCFPKVVEESEKIPRIADRHVYSDNTLCLAVEPEDNLLCRRGITFKYFLDKVLVPHLSRETYRNLSGKYEDGEYSHGVGGLWEYFGYMLSVKDKKSILEELEKMLFEKWPERNETCFCGSSFKFKNCHIRKWQSLMSLGNDYLISRLEILKNDYHSLAKKLHVQ